MKSLNRQATKLRWLVVLLALEVSSLLGCAKSSSPSSAGSGSTANGSTPASDSAAVAARQSAVEERPAEGRERKALSQEPAAVDSFPPSSLGSQPSDLDPQPFAVSTRSKETNRAQRSEWPCWQGPNADDTSAETGVLREFPASGPNVVWRVKLGTGFSGVAVAGGRVITLFGEGGREKIVCFDAATGRELWKVDSDADFAEGRSYGPRAMPCVDGDRVYAVGASGKLFCLEAETGRQVWMIHLYGKFGMRLHEEGLSPSPLVDGKKLLVLAGNSAFAFDKSTGEVIWKALDEKMNHSSPRLANLDGRRQLLVLTGSNLVGLDPESGRELWRHPQQAVNIATPVVGPNDQIFTAAAYGFGCQLVRVEGGRPRQVYKNMALATHHATAVLYDGHLYGFDDRPGILKCVEFATGEEKWVSRSSGKGKLIIADGQLIILNEAGVLLLAPATPDGYKPTAEARVLGETCYTAPSLANGRLYLRSNAEMVCVDMKPRE